jgi:hypothetical protein
MTDELNMDVWLQALQEAMAPKNYPGGRTVKEISEATHIPDRKVRLLIGNMMAKGMVKCLRVSVKAIDGRITTVPAYIIVDKKENT